MSQYRDKDARARRSRRGVPIHAYVGPNGGGKSIAMIYDTLPSLAMGRSVLSTVHLLDWTIPDVDKLHMAVPPGSDAKCNPEAHHPLFTELCDYRQLLDAEHCDVLLDEVTGVASSRESATMPAEIANLLVQLRRRDLCMRWTAPNWSRADVIIRECSQAVTTCRGFMRQKSFTERHVIAGHRPVEHAEVCDGRIWTDYDLEAAHAELIEPADVALSPGCEYGDDCPLESNTDTVPIYDVVRERNLWPSRRWFLWKTYDAIAFDEWDSKKAETIKPMARQFFRRPGSLAEVAYDTLASVSGLASISEHGRCLDCGGQRTRPKCGCRAATLQQVAREMAG